MSVERPTGPGPRRQRPAMTAERRRRRSRRRWLVLGALPLWLPMIVLGVVLVLNDVNTRVGIGDFEDGRYSTARWRFGAVDRTNLVEKWRAPFNLGTTEFRDGDLFRALDDLDRSLTLVPDDHRCMVQVNRAHVLEAWGDEELVWAQEESLWAEQAQELVDAGKPYPADAPWGEAAPWELRENAQEYAGWAEADFAAAIEARADPACDEESQASPEQQEQNDQAQDGLQDKQDQAEEAGEEEGEPQEQPEGSTPQEEEAERQEQLAERNAEAEAEAEAERQREAEDGDLGGGETKNW